MKTTSASFGLVSVLIAVAALITAVIHLFLGIRDISSPLGILFVLNGLGYIGLTTAFLFPFSFLAPVQPLIRWILAGFAGLTFILYFVFNGIALDAASGAAKGAELVLIVLLMFGRR